MKKHVLVIGAMLAMGIFSYGQEKVNTEPGDEANGLFAGGNYAEALELYKKRMVSPDYPDEKAAKDIHNAISCMGRLGSIAEWDTLLENTVTAHPRSWRIAIAVYNNRYNIQESGMLIDGVFYRGYSMRGGKYVNTQERDRIRMLQLLLESIPTLEADANAAQNDKRRFFMALASLFNNRGAREAWRLQVLTDVNKLPDWDSAENDYDFTQGAPVDEKGNPVFYYIPESFEKARNDGERWRWALKKAADYGGAFTADMQLALFCESQFGVTTLRNYSFDNSADNLGSILALDKLKDNETIARMANGIKRITLPDEFAYIKIFKRLAEQNPQDSAPIVRLANIYSNRRQYAESVEWWKKYAKFSMEQATRRIEEITGNWGRFDTGMPQLAGKKAQATLRFRNAKSAQLTAWRIDLPKLLEDVNEIIEDSDGDKHFPREYTGIHNLCNIIVNGKGKKYLKEKVAEWTLELSPEPGYKDTVTTITTPITDMGTYMLECKLPGGNTSRISLVLEAMKIVSKNIDKAVAFQVLEAKNGHPVPNLKVDLFGWQESWNSSRKRIKIDVKKLSSVTDKDGFVYLTRDELGKKSFRWNVSAFSEQYGFACLANSWHGIETLSDSKYMETKTFALTDRPVYRPGDKVHLRLWAARVSYNSAKSNTFAGTSGDFILSDTNGKHVLTKKLTADSYGAVETEWVIPEDSPLGMYSFSWKSLGSGMFRVEEYKKPEFEVSVTSPDAPVMLGDKVEMTVRAKYYFGAPVTDASINLKVLRNDYRASWWPVRPWDWFYGNGYGWLWEDYIWYPGWKSWGCLRPAPFWSPLPRTAPEVVMQLKGKLEPDGTFKVLLDTAMAKEIFGDRDHRYELTAEVRDKSRRTILGNASVIVARKPFEVYVWADRGHYNVGDKVTVNALARRLDGKTVKGAGRMKLYRITYSDEGIPEETLVKEWSLDTNDKGNGAQVFSASEPGQFRVSYSVSDAAGRSVEGAAIISIRGKDMDNRHFRYNGLELIPDKMEYAPGETVRLAVNTEQSDSTVMLFLRCVYNLASNSKVLRLKGKSAIVEIPVTIDDMPNFFIEAYTLCNGVLHHVSREIMVPPVNKVLDVEVLGPAKVKPGSVAEVKVRITKDGKPVSGCLTAAVYDKSLDYIAGDAAVADIREVFWKWRRVCNPNVTTMLWNLYNTLGKDEKSMPQSGIFERIAADMKMDGYARNRNSVPLYKPSKALGHEVMRMKSAADVSEMAVPAMAAPAMESPVMEAAAAGMDMGAEKGGSQAPEVTVRKNFADTAYWVGALMTDANGVAALTVPMPESLTTWKTTVWAMGEGTSVGSGSLEIITAKDLMVRLQAPRFFVEKDQVVLSAIINNYLPADEKVTAVLELDGGCLSTDNARQEVKVPSNGELRVDWRCQVLKAGQAVIRVKALAKGDSDAMEQSFPVLTHGMDKMVAASRMLSPEQSEFTVALDVPEAIREGSGRLELRWSPSLAMAMTDAIPYLIDYPYGCTEQTLNRFLPAVLARDTMKRLGISLDDVAKQRANLNAQEIGNPDQRKSQWKRYQRDPVFNEAELNIIIRKGISDLLAMQCSDGGWGWFSGWGEYSGPHTTAQVVHGFIVAEKLNLPIYGNALKRGIAWLENYQKREIQKLHNAKEKIKPWKQHADEMDALVFKVLSEVGKNNVEMDDFLYRDKNEISVYGKALYGLGLVAGTDKMRLSEVMRNIRQYLVVDDENQTAYLELRNSNYWWYWYGDEIEAHAAYLALLAATDPKGEIAPRIVKYLLNNRKHATYWRSTRDTAACLEAFADYIRQSGEDNPNMTVEILLDGRKVADAQIDRENLFTANLTAVLEGKDVTPGKHKLTVRKKGTGPLYFNSYLTYFTLEDFIPKAGLEVKVERRVYRLTREDEMVHTAGSRGQAVSKRVEKYKRETLDSGAVVKSGDLLEVELVIESKNDYEYLLIEDFKAAGTEAVDQRSGYNGNSLGAYMEFRDTKVALLLRTLPRGKHSVSYRLRAEVPGRFSALPTVISGMYAPELKGNSDEMKLGIDD